VSKWFETRRRRGCPAAILGQKGYGDEKEWQKILRKIRNMDHIRATTYVKKRRTSPAPLTMTSSSSSSYPTQMNSAPTFAPSPMLPPMMSTSNPNISSSAPAFPPTNPSSLPTLPHFYEPPSLVSLSIGSPPPTTNTPPTSPTPNWPYTLPNPYLGNNFGSTSPTTISPTSSPHPTFPPTAREERVKQLSEAMAHQQGADGPSPLDLLCVASLTSLSEDLPPTTTAFPTIAMSPPPPPTRQFQPPPPLVNPRPVSSPPPPSSPLFPNLSSPNFPPANPTYTAPSSTNIRKSM